MKTHYHICRVLLASVAAVFFSTAAPSSAAPSSVAPKTPGATNAPPEALIPQSVFKFPAGPKDGRDPFFPKSARPYQNVAVTTNLNTAFNASDFTLKGISGPPNHRLAIINSQTFEKGEEGEVTTPRGKRRIRCDEIGDNSVTISFGNPPQRIELRMRPGF